MNLPVCCARHRLHGWDSHSCIGPAPEYLTKMPVDKFGDGAGDGDWYGDGSGYGFGYGYGYGYGDGSGYGSGY